MVLALLPGGAAMTWNSGPCLPEPAMSEPLWCWCCAAWGLSVAAIDAAKRLCQRCVNSSPTACKNRHMAEALEAGLKEGTS